MRTRTDTRRLSATERKIITDVFDDSLPAWDRILLTDGLGGGDRPFTMPAAFFYWIHVGPKVYPDASLTLPFDSESRYVDVLVHEMTHVWQYYHGYSVVLSSAWAQTGGSGYSYTVGKDWGDYNSEQQAQLVEDWYHNGAKTSDQRFPYIDKIIRPGVGATTTKDVAIDVLTAHLRHPILGPGLGLVKDLIDKL